MGGIDQVHLRVISRIPTLADQAGIPISHIPDRDGVARSHFWNVLKGETSPSLRWLVQVAEIFEVDLEVLTAIEIE
jgi:hypothetical protein